MANDNRTGTGFAHTRDLPERTGALILGYRLPFAWVQVDVTMRSGVKVPFCFELGEGAAASRFARDCNAVHAHSAFVGNRRMRQEPEWV